LQTNLPATIAPRMQHLPLPVLYLSLGILEFRVLLFANKTAYMKNLLFIFCILLLTSCWKIDLNYHSQAKVWWNKAVYAAIDFLLTHADWFYYHKTVASRFLSWSSYLYTNSYSDLVTIDISNLAQKSGLANMDLLYW